MRSWLRVIKEDDLLKEVNSLDEDVDWDLVPEDEIIDASQDIVLSDSDWDYL